MNVKICYKQNSPHISQILTGYIKLKKMFDSLDIVEDSSLNYPNGSSMYVFLGGKYTVLYDMHDGYTINSKFLEKGASHIDVYFKRSYNESENLKNIPEAFQAKIHPLPFNYHVTCKENPLDRISFNFLYNHEKTASNLTGRILRVIKNGYLQTSNKKIVTEAFSTKIQYVSNPKILFSTRVYDVEIDDQRLRDERLKINRERVELIELLRSEFPDNFIGGLEYSKFSKENYPGLILPFRTTERLNYLKLMKSADICIATAGLHKSNGWKLGEYIASSKCVVHSPFYYEPVGNFTEKKNYFTFKNNQDLISILNYLVSNPRIIYETKINNLNYFNTSLSPEILVYNTIRDYFI